MPHLWTVEFPLIFEEYVFRIKEFSCYSTAVCRGNVWWLFRNILSPRPLFWTRDFMEEWK